MMLNCEKHDEEDCYNQICHWTRTFGGGFTYEALLVIIAVNHLVEEQLVMQLQLSFWIHMSEVKLSSPEGISA